MLGVKRSSWRGSKVLVGESLKPATVVVENGKVVEVVDGLQMLEGIDKVVDVGDNILMPGLVDSHVHINEPGRTDWEGFSTATKAAAAGGVTTVVDMPLNSLPPTTTVENLKVKVDAAKGQCWVDVAFWGGVIPGNSGSLKDMAALGVPGFKCFLIHSGVDEFPAVNREQALEALAQMKGTGATLLFHAECEIDDIDSSGDPANYTTFLDSRPPAMEISAIQLVISLCRDTKVPCHIVHLSAAQALPIIRAARAEGLPLTVETCHHYLNLTAEEIPARATQFKCCPPIRSSSNQETLWQAVIDGDIDMLVSDHSPCTPDLKKPGINDFMDSWGGISSLQFGLSLFWGQAAKRGLTLQNLNQLMCLAPARLAGLSHCKGQIAPGFDADFVVWAPEQCSVVTVENIQHKNKITPYLGRTLQGVVLQTILAGNVIYSRQDGFVGQPSGALLIGTKTKSKI